jgi:Sap, sulfolipid-1-addressing protein
MAAVDSFTPVKSLGLGAAMSGVNPKNLVLSAAAAMSIAQTGLPAGQQIVVLAVFVVVGTVTVAAPLVVYLALGHKADSILDGWREWLTANNAAIMLVVFLVFGFVLIGQGIGRPLLRTGRPHDLRRCWWLRGCRAARTTACEARLVVSNRRLPPGRPQRHSQARSPDRERRRRPGRPGYGGDRQQHVR